MTTKVATDSIASQPIATPSCSKQKTVKDPLFLVYVCEFEQDEESLYTVQIWVPRSIDSKEASEVAANLGCTILLALHIECSVSNLFKNETYYS